MFDNAAKDDDRSTRAKRVQFDLGPAAVAALDELQQRLEAKTRAEVFRDAIRLYAWMVSQRKDGWEIWLRREGKEKHVELALPGLEIGSAVPAKKPTV